MKRIFSSFIAVCLLLSMFTGLVGAEVNKDSKNIQVYTKGRAEIATTTFNTLSETDTSETAEVIESDGKDSKGNFKVDLLNFSGVIELDGDTYELEGSRVEEEESLYYKGDVVNKGTNVKFEALLSQDAVNKNKHKALINVITLESESDVEPKDVVSFSFDNHSSKVTKKNVVIPKVKVQKDGDLASITGDFQTASSSYYEYLTGYYGTYMQTLVAGAKQVKVDAGSNYSVRSTTKSADITKYWRDQGYSVYDTKLAE